tara:strand:+ start:1018 stop:1938 length:921 start_codon:yes stop_codon:yes gene_type:complete
MLFHLKKTFKNSGYVLSRAFKNDFPINSILRNGKKVKIRTFNAMYFISQAQKIQNVGFDFNNDTVTIQPNEKTNQKIIFYGGLDNGDIVNIFLKKNYDVFKVKDNTVIDIGANIGDTAIFFAHNGAKRIIGVEPFHKNFEVAEKNVNANKLTDTIVLIKAGCGSKTGSVKIDPGYDSSIESRLVDFNEGEYVPVITLQDIIQKYSIPIGSALKIDCEGCEYDIIENTPSNIISHFNHIQIEYHSGYRSLKRKLESIGYDVIITKPHATDVVNSFFSKFRRTNPNLVKGKFEHKIGYAGFIFATKNN